MYLMIGLKYLMRSLVLYVFVLSAGCILFLAGLFDLREFLTFMIATIGTLPLISTVFIRKYDALSPVVLLPFTYTLYAIGPLQLAPNFSDDVFIKYLSIQLLGLLAMRSGLYTSTRQRCDYNSAYSILDLSKARSRTALKLTVIIMVVLSFISLATYFAAFGSLTGYLDVGYGGRYFLIAKESKLIGPGFEWMLLSSILLGFYGLKARSPPYLFIGIIFFLFSSGVVLLTGRRSQIIFPLIFAIVLIHFCYKRIPSLLIVACLVLGVSIAQYYALARANLSEGLLYALSSVWPAVRSNPSIIYPWMANEFRMPAASLLEILQYGGPEMLFGRSYLAILGAPIPFVARLFSSISFDVNTWRLETFYPDLLASGGGLAFSPVTEGYMNFGIVGVGLHLYIYGYVIGLIYNRFSSKPTISNLLLFAGSLPVFMLDGMRTTVASFGYRWFRVYLMPWIIFWVLRLIIPKQEAKKY